LTKNLQIKLTVDIYKSGKNISKERHLFGRTTIL